jgi:hypothetical protein
MERLFIFRQAEHWDVARERGGETTMARPAEAA